MINKLKNSSALQRARQMSAAAMLCVLCVLLFMPAGCGSKPNIMDSDDENQMPEVDESQIPNVYDNPLTEDELYGGDDFYYRDDGEKEYFKIRKDRVIIKTISAEKAKALCRQNIFLSAYDMSYIWVLATIDPRQIILEDLLQMEDVIDATYGLEYRDGTLQYPKDQIYIIPKNGLSVENVLEKNGLSENIVEIEEPWSYSEIYKVTLNVRLADILQVCRTLFESELCEAAGPSCIRVMKKI